jgi:hypothetical protein
MNLLRHLTGGKNPGGSRRILRAAAVKGLTALALLLATASCALWRAVPVPYGDEATAVRSLETPQQRLEASDAASVNLLLTDIGRIDYPGFTSVFWRMVYRPFVPGLKRVLIVAGVRGNEAAGVECALALIEKLQAAPGRGSLFNADILPVVNTWGWVHDLGRNQEKVDIEQDFGSFASREARIIRRFLRGKRYDLVVDLREDPDATGFSIRQYGLEATTVSERIVAEIRAGGYPIETRAGGVWMAPQDGILTAPMWRLALMAWVGEVSLPVYARRQVSAAVYTVVTPTILLLADRVALQRTALEALIAEHAAAPEPPDAGPPPSRTEAP